MDEPLAPEDAKEIVRGGYNAISYAYRDDVGASEQGYSRWLNRYLIPRLPAPARVLDLGCGNGIPATRLLAERYEVTGVDISDVQIERARKLVPRAAFIRADFSAVAFGRASFDGVVSFFALIHAPLEGQLQVLNRVAEWLAPGGVFVATVGHASLTATGDFYGAQMYWSQADAETYCTWLSDVGIEVVEREFIPEEPHGGHELLVGVRRSAPAGG